MKSTIIKYKEPRTAIYLGYPKNGKYIMGQGWETIKIKTLVQGEDDFLFVIDFDKPCQSFHKSRLVQWVNDQRNLL